MLRYPRGNFTNQFSTGREPSLDIAVQNFKNSRKFFTKFFCSCGVKSETLSLKIISNSCCSMLVKNRFLPRWGLPEPSEEFIELLGDCNVLSTVSDHFGRQFREVIEFLLMKAQSLPPRL